MKNAPMLFLWLFISAFFFISSCKKDNPASSAGNPVFYFRGTINGSSVNLQAGVNDYYMYSSYLQDANNVYNFYGDLRQTNCTTCNTNIQFKINDYKVSALNAPTLIDSSLHEGYYPFQVSNSAPTTYPVIFTSIPSDIPMSYLWDFGDGSTDNGANPAHVYSGSGSYTVCLKITYANSCQSSICNVVQVGVGNECNLLVDLSGINAGSTCDGTITSLVKSGGTPPYSYSWNNGQTTSTATGLCAGCYSLKVTDANGCSTLTNWCIGDAVTVANCFTNFSYTLVNQNSFSLSKIAIRWTDNSGVVYTSTNASQPNDSYFQIISVENYSNNQNNQPTKKLHVKFKCRVYDNSGNYYPVENGDAVIAVSYR